MGQNIKPLLALLTIAALAGGAYFAINKLGLLDTTAQLSAYETSVADIERESALRVNQINSITLDAGVFERADFRSLNDIRVELPAPVVSRSDPFAQP